MSWFFSSLLGGLGALTVAALCAILLRSVILNWIVDSTLVRLLKDHYTENLWDVVVGVTRVPPHVLMELELRAEFGQTLERPLGSIRRLPDFAGVGFNPAQLITQPLGPQVPVDLTTILGPRAIHPLRLQIPLMISAMGYGVALSKPLVLALARGATRVGTAYNAGSGPVLDEILQETGHLVLQYGGGSWTRDEDLLSQADMIEINCGHGGRAALGRVISGSELPPEARKMIGVTKGGEAIMSAPLPGAATPAELKKLVPELRSLIEGRPVGVKLAATHDLERELAIVLEAGVDIVAIDGCQGGTHSSPPIIADDFGIPTLYALRRAVLFMEQSGSRQAVSLVISGGLRTPGEYLKALALGADAIYVGTAAMMAATHGALSQVVPFEPITQLAWATGKKAQEFDLEKGAETVANFLVACAGEMAEAARALGKQRIRDVSREDLIALDLETAQTLGLSAAWHAPSHMRMKGARP